MPPATATGLRSIPINNSRETVNFTYQTDVIPGASTLGALGALIGLADPPPGEMPDRGSRLPFRRAKTDAGNAPIETCCCSAKDSSLRMPGGKGRKNGGFQPWLEDKLSMIHV